MCAFISCNRVDFNPGGCVNHRYTVVRPLGEGTFGRVYLVRRIEDGSLFALKLLKLWTVEPAERERLQKRFGQEYETGRIKSDYLVQSYDYGIIEGNPYIVMEYCPGGDLIDGIESGRLCLTESVCAILKGMRDLHVNGKVHRDLKPENVLIKTTGTLALTDFGISGDRNKRLTERGIMGVPKEVFGTYAYMPPEQVNPKRGESTVLPTTDIFSFGVLLFQLLTHVLPFGSLDNEGELYQYVTRGRNEDWDRSAISRCHDGAKWLPLIEGCLCADFKRRIQTAEDALRLVPSDSMHAPVIPCTKLQRSRPECGWLLRVMQGEEFGKTYQLTDIVAARGRNVLTIGRNDEETTNIIPIKETESSYISRKHCTLEYNNMTSVWMLRDGQWDPGSYSRWKASTNGTFIDSREVSMNGEAINIGDIISIGDVKLRVEGY